MADELYDYFGGNASKKVEPIEDDDLEMLEDEVGSIQPIEQTGEVTAEASSSPEHSPLPVDQPDPAPAMQSEEIVADEPAGKQETKKSGHWDFLANMLGIGPSKTEPKTQAKDLSSEQPVAKAPSTSRTVSKRKPAAKSPLESNEDTEIPSVKSAADSDQSEFFGLEPIPSEEESTVLPSMFSASETGNATDLGGEDPNELIGWDPLPPKSHAVDSADLVDDSADLVDDSADSESIEAEPLAEFEEPVAFVEDDDIDGDDEDGFVEFEIEDLDDSPVDEDRERAHGRSSRRRKPPVEDSSVEPTDRPRSRRTRNRPEKTRSEKTRSEKTRSEETRSEKTRDIGSEDSSNDSRSETRSSSRSRGSRSRGRGERSRSDESPKRYAKQKDDFVPEDLEPIDLPPFAEGLDDIDLDDDPVELDRVEPDRKDTPRTGRKRRRRRGGKGRSEKSESEPVRAERDDGFGAGIDDENEFPMDDNDSAAYDSSYRSEPAESGLDDFEKDSSEDRAASRGRGRNRGRARGRKSEDDSSRSGDSDTSSTGERKRAKVPTWDEAITVLINSNIENHKKSGSGQPRRGGSRGGSRGDSGRGSGNRGDGNRGDGNREDGNRGQNRGRRR